MPGEAVGSLLEFVRRLPVRGTAESDADDALLQRYVAHRDDGAFGELVRRHGKMVWRVCRSILAQDSEAEDAFQATFLVLAKSAHNVRNRGALHCWLYGVALRCAKALRAALIERKRSERSGDAPEPTYEERERDEQHWIVAEEVDRLPRKYRTPIVLCFYQGLTHTQAARALNWPVGTVAARINRAKVLLKKRLIRRHIAYSVAGTVALWSQSQSYAAPSAQLTTTTALIGQNTQISPSALKQTVVTLAQGVMSQMSSSKLTLSIAIAAVFAAAVLTTSGIALSSNTTQGEGSFATNPTVQKKPNAGPAANLFPPVKKIETLFVMYRHLNLKKDVKFKAPKSHWQKIINTMLPARIEKKPAKWEQLGKLIILTNDGKIKTLFLYNVRNGKGAFSTAMRPPNRTYFRGGGSKQLQQALNAAYAEAQMKQQKQTNNVDYQRKLKTVPFVWDGNQATLLYSMQRMVGGYQVQIKYNPARRYQVDMSFLKDGKEVHKYKGHFGTVFSIQGDVLYLAVYNRSSTGCEVRAIDLRQEKTLWKTHVKGVGPIFHSRYVNHVCISANEQVVTIKSRESSGDYIEYLDPRTGRTLANRVYRKNFKTPNSGR